MSFLWLLGALGLGRLSCDLARQLHWHLLRSPTRPLQRYGDGRGRAWAVVTGASSGIGESFARELAKDGFSLVLCARREDRLKALALELEQQFNVEARYIVVDFSAFPSEHDEFMRRVRDVTLGNVGIVVHMAGNSDLAVHMTDKPLERNLEIMRLCAESTLVMLQDFLPLFVARGRQCGFIASGAMTAYLAKPGYATSTANKHYVRGLCQCVAHEFRGFVDVMVAHPIVVQSEIVVKKIPLAISPGRFARNCLSDLGQTDESNGFWGHDLLMYFLQSLPTWLFVRWAYSARQLERESKILNRPADMRPLGEKFVRGS